METIITIDDGHFLDLKVKSYLDRYNLKGLFFIPTNHIIERGDIRKISVDHEIGGHTTNHKVLTKLLDQQIEREVTLNLEYLEGIIGKKITKFAYPKGWYDERVVDVIKKKCDLKECYTMKLGITNKCYNKLSLPRTFHVRPREEYKEDGLVLSAKKLYKHAREQREGYFNLCLHSWEVEKYDTWDELDQILKFIKENEN